MATEPRRHLPATPARVPGGGRPRGVESAVPDPVGVRDLVPLLAPGGTRGVAPVPHRPRPPDPAAVLALQRVHGNAFVASLIARNTPQLLGTEVGVGARSAPATIAREPDDYAEEDDEYRRQTAEDEAERRDKERRTDRRGGTRAPPTGADVTRDADSQIGQMIEKAKAEGYRHVNTANRQRATSGFAGC